MVFLGGREGGNVFGRKKNQDQTAQHKGKAAVWRLGKGESSRVVSTKKRWSTSRRGKRIGGGGLRGGKDGPFSQGGSEGFNQWEGGKGDQPKKKSF